MAEKLILNHERVDDIPLLIGLTLRLRLPEVLDRWLGHHGHHQGLTVGWLATVWLAYIPPYASYGPEKQLWPPASGWRRAQVQVLPNSPFSAGYDNPARACRDLLTAES